MPVPTIKSIKKSASLKKDETGSDPVTMDNFNLSNIGTYMLFNSVDRDSAEDFCEFIIKSNYVFPKTQVLTVLLNCPGGGVYDGFGMIDLMQCSRLRIQTVAVGVVASMGALIFTAGDPGHRIMSKNSFIMTHQFSDSVEGKYHEFVASRPHNDDIHDRFVKHFVKHSKMTEKQVKDVILNSSDRYISAKEALKFGLCDTIKEPWS